MMIDLAYPGREQPLQKQGDVFADFDSGHGFTKQSAQGTQTDETGIVIKGAGSLSLTSDGAGSAVFSRKTSISPTISMTGKFLKVWLYVDNKDDLTELWFYASPDNFTSFYTWKVSDDLTQVVEDTWVPITLSFGEAETTGSPSRGAINALQIRIKDDTTGISKVYFDNWSTVDEPTAGAVSIVFDDGFDDVWDEARKKMDEYGFVGTNYIIPELIGTTNYLSLTEAKNLELGGWENSAHGLTNFTTYNQETLQRVFYQMKSWMRSHGFVKGIDDVSYPNGGTNETVVIPTTKQFFRSGRTIANYAETIPPADPYRLRVMQVLNTTTTASVQTAVTSALNNKHWLILLFHQLVASPTTSTQYSITDFGTIIDDIESQGIDVRLLSDVLNHG